MGVLRNELYRDADWLRYKYVEEELSCQGIADLCNCSGRNILNWLCKHGIPRRSLSEARRASWAAGVYDSEETRRRMSEALRARWAAGDLDSEEIRRKMSESTRANWASEEYREKVSDGMRPHLASEEYHRKLSEGAKAKWVSEGYRRKQAEAQESSWTSVEIREKRIEGMRINWMSVEYRRKQAEAMRARWTPEARSKMGEAVRARWAAGVFDSEGTRGKISEAIRAKWAAGDYDDAKRRVPFCEYNGIWFRSTWEVRLAKVFDARGWAWQYEPCRIPYTLDGVDHTYKPDFYVPELDMYFDPHWSFYKDDWHKFRAVREQVGITLVVLDEKLLRAYEGAIALT